MTAEPGATPAEIERKLDLLENQFGALFDTIRQRLRTRSTAIDPTLQPAGYRALMALAQLGPTSPTVIAEALGFDKSVLSRQLHQLGELGLVTREPDAKDGRAVVITLTPTALARIEAANAEDRDLFRSRLGTWDAEDLDTLIRLLAKLQNDPPQRQEP